MIDETEELLLENLPVEWFTKRGNMRVKLGLREKTLIFIARFRAVHKNRYDYSNVWYTSPNVKVRIGCSIHGDFYMAARDHQRGRGRQECGGSVHLSTTRCIADFKTAHGDTYDYSKVAYVNSETKVAIGCRKLDHGLFMQKPSHHKGGVGCPKCAGKAHDVLYLWRIPTTNTYKIGITTRNRGIKRITEVGSVHGVTPEILCFHYCKNPNVLEAELKERYKSYWTKEGLPGDGYTEMFDLTETQVTEIKEFILS